MVSQQKFKRIALAFAATALPCLAQAKQPNPDRYIVKFAPGKAAEARAALTRAAARVALELPVHDAVAVVLPAAALAGLSRNPNVEYIEPDVLRYPMALTSNSTGSPYELGQLVPYGIKMVQADQVSDTLAGSRKVCIIDSGYNVAHEDLSQGGNVSGTDDPTGAGLWEVDENHHGTHVAGTISALNQPGIGVVGVAPNSILKLHIVKVFDAAGWAYSSSLTAAVDMCAAAGANVISMSLGGSFSSRTESNAFDKYYKQSPKSILSIAAAGNGGNSRVSYPAGYTNVVSVAAIDENKAWASFSSSTRTWNWRRPAFRCCRPYRVEPRGSRRSVWISPMPRRRWTARQRVHQRRTQHWPIAERAHLRVRRRPAARFASFNAAATPLPTRW